MFHVANSTENSDAEANTITHVMIDSETEECYETRLCDCQKQSLERQYRNPMRFGYYCNREQVKPEIDLSELDRRRKKRTKNQLQHYPSCHCSVEAIKHSLVPCCRYPDNLDAVLNRYESNYLVDLNTETTKKQQKRQTNVHRHHRRNDQDQMLSAIMEIRSPDENLEADCRHAQFGKNGYRADAQSRDGQAKTMSRGLRNSNMYPEVPVKYTYYRSSHAPRRNNSGANEDSDRRQRKFDQDDANRVRSRYDARHYETKNSDVGNMEQHREEQVKEKLNHLPSKLSAVRLNSARTTGLQTLTRSKNTEDLTRLKPLAVDVNNYSKDEDSQILETENAKHKPCKQSTRRSSVCKLGDLSSDGDVIAENTRYEIMTKEDDYEAVNRQCTYAGGDLDLHATKNHILDLIDRALCIEFGSTTDQQKNTDSNRELPQHEVFVEITRALQDDSCQSFAEDLSSNRESKYIRLMKVLRSEQLNHIHDKMKKLCNLQKFLDSCSPRPSTSTPQAHSGAVEQHPEERQQQQHDEKQSLKTIVS